MGLGNYMAMKSYLISNVLLLGSLFGPCAAMAADKGDDLFADQGLFADDSFFSESKKPEPSEQEKEAVRRQAQRSIRDARAEADSQLFQQMRAVANWVDNWILFNHRFVEYGDQTTMALQQLDDLVPNNPYSYSSTVSVPGLDADANYEQVQEEAANYPTNTLAPHRVKFVRDFGMTTANIDQWSREVPSDWRETPGTITVITNDQYLFCVWGAGADGRAIKDPFTRRTRLCIGNYQMWDAPVMDLQVD